MQTDFTPIAHAFWHAVARQDAHALAAFFSPDAVVRWHCTNERFTATAFVRANCEYPGEWRGAVERVEPIPGGMVTVARVEGGGLAFHAVSFFGLDEAGLITTLDEYWGDDGDAPSWRQALGLAQPIG